MTRSILAQGLPKLFGGLFACAVVTVLAAPGCKQTGVGDPCTPEREYDVGFNGFDVKEVEVESKSFQCQTRLCLVNHFQGRVSCKYGQDANGNGSDGTSKTGCTVPGSNTPITGAGGAAGEAVPAQCTDRTADKAVYCSCRCANVDGKTDDGANYCTCPDGFTCEPLVSSIGAGDTGLTGSYCIKSGTRYESANACAATCSPTGTTKCD